MDDFGLHDIHGHPVTDDEIEAMRYWVGDSPWANPDGIDIATLSPAAVVAGVRDHYQGGVTAFLAELHAELEV
jgi:hypothetical protein